MEKRAAAGMQPAFTLQSDPPGVGIVTSLSWRGWGTEGVPAALGTLMDFRTQGRLILWHKFKFKASLSDSGKGEAMTKRRFVLLSLLLVILPVPARAFAGSIAAVKGNFMRKLA